MKDDRDRFLGSVADYYLNRSDVDMAGLWIVLPNKRAVIYMRRYLRKLSRCEQILPELITIGAFNERICPDYEIADRVTLLFKLYRAYLSVMRSNGLNAHPFSRFAYWGDMILNDFEQIDESLVDAGKLYRNMNEYLEIRSNFLSEEQIDALGVLLGKDAVERLKAETNSDEFWMHIERALPLELDDIEKETDPDGDDVYKTGRRFRHLWQILGDIHRVFLKEIETDGENQVFGGRLVRKVYECIRHTEAVPGFSRIAFVGFGNLTLAQAAMMKVLQKRGVADFFWDTPDPRRLQNIDGGRMAGFVNTFPMPEGYRVPRAHSLPQLNIVGVPSNFLQTKIVGQTLSSWHRRGFVNPVNPDNTLVMLPDTSLLSAVIHGLPDIKVDSDDNVYNISMGLSFRQTPFAALLRAIVNLQAHLRNVRGELMFMREDVATLVSMPQFAALFPQPVSVVNKYLREHAVFNICARELCELPGAEPLRPFFVEITDTHDVGQVREYVYGFIDALEAALSVYSGPDEIPDEGEPVVGDDDSYMPDDKKNEERVLSAYRAGTDRIFECLDRYDINAVSEVHLLNLVERIMAVSQLNMHGTPVHGIQILGALETRALDFDNIIVTSMNERVMPRRARMRSLIPQSFRKAFHLPTTESIDNEYAYYFLRLLNRADRITCLYDSRSKGLACGAMSRYALQLRLMSPPDMVRMYNVTLNAQAPEERVITIPRDNDEVQTLLAGFTDGVQGYNLSASAIKTFLKCPLQFYLKCVRGIREENELTDYVDAATYGTIVHRAMENIYNEMRGPSKSPYRVSDAKLKHYIDSPAAVVDHVRRVMMDVYYKERMRSLTPDTLPAEGALLSEVMADYVVAALKKDYDRLSEPGAEQFWFVCAEAQYNTFAGRGAIKVGQWRVNDTMSINVRMDVDRLDKVHTAGGVDMLRFIDYKTGADVNEVPAMDKLISENVARDGKWHADGMFQLLLYCMWYCDLTGYTGLIRPTLYRLQKAFSNNPKGHESFEYDGIYVKEINKDEPLVWSGDPEHQPAWQIEFRRRVVGIIESIFNPELDFGQVDWTAGCNYCMFRNLCGRPEKKQDY